MVAFLTRMIEVANGALDGPNREAFLTELVRLSFLEFPMALVVFVGYSL